MERKQFDKILTSFKILRLGELCSRRENTLKFTEARSEEKMSN
jgi:hypothetical protein